MIAVSIVASWLLFLFILERITPLRKSTAPFSTRLIVNAGLSLIMFSTALFSVKPISHASLNYVSLHHFGLLSLTTWPLWLKHVLSFLWLDLSFYYWHRLSHRFPPIWVFHLVHHIDPDLDVTTAFRFHFCEILISCLFRLVQITSMGVTLEAFLVYEVCFQCFTLFHHANINLSSSLDHALQTVIVTPRMHGVHHSQVTSETNANYGVIFSVWDRIHRSYKTHIPQERITIGVNEYTQEDNHITPCLLQPFKKQRLLKTIHRN